MLEQATQSKNPEQAALLRLSAADLAYRQGNAGQSAQILQQVPVEQLKPGQHVLITEASHCMAPQTVQLAKALGIQLGFNANDGD